jgi:NAD(P)-dependent dehydrogenase (short-subunit alcohol dehydrogenase family)/uncharacterized protein YndB with AHSA1/START domain
VLSWWREAVRRAALGVKEARMEMGSQRLKGQVAVVTGGGRGIGRTIGLLLATAGASVAVFARTESELTETVKLIEQAKGRSRPFVVDVTNSHAVSQKFAEVEASLGPVDLLVNNAAIVGPICPLWESSLEDWWRVMDVNLRGPMLCSHAVLPGMISRKHGRIVNIVNSATPLPYLSSYMTSKTALVRLTEILAAETKEYGISMFSLGPGTVRTAMSERSLYSEEAKKWIPWFRRIFDEGLNLPAERPAQYVVELASGRADALSGRFLSVSDDLDELLRNVKQIEENDLYSLRTKTLKPAIANATLASIRAEAERPSRNSLHIESTIDVPHTRVFHAWIDPDAIQKWFTNSAPVHWSPETGPIVDARTGGSYRWRVVRDGNEKEVFEFHGTYREVHAPERLAFTWEWETLPIDGVEGPGKTLVTIEFFEQAGSTKVVLMQTGFPNNAARDAHGKGWARCLDGIAKLFH